MVTIFWENGLFLYVGMNNIGNIETKIYKFEHYLYIVRRCEAKMHQLFKNLL